MALTRTKNRVFILTPHNNPSTFVKQDVELEKITQQLVNDFFLSNGQNFWTINDSLFAHNDEYFVLRDFRSYMDMWYKLVNIYHNDKMLWNKMSLCNIANSGYFSSDRTIEEYNKDIWHV